ncbi:MAG TPA: hypothetical protein VFF95_02415 [Candidatus Binatus sp.]|jgi:hypothetical protein|nr:hypothetical protein [Candidatus Binatus sp.]
MSSLSSKDRVSLCLFSFTDGRRCRTPRTGRHPHFCFYHAQKEARAQAAEKLGEDLAYFFSGDYLSACDLSTALSRLIPAVVRGDIKPRLARTVAYMIQSLIQTIHLSQDEYINAFSTDGWREAVRKSVKLNSDYENSQQEAGEPEQNPPQPATQSKQPAQPAPSKPSQPAQTQTRPQQPATSTPPQPTASSTQTPSRPQEPAPKAPPRPSARRPSPATAKKPSPWRVPCFPAALIAAPLTPFKFNIYTPPRYC